MRSLVALLLVLAACTSPPSPEAGPPGDGSPDAAPVGVDDAIVQGTVTSVDLDPWAYDGDGLVELATDDGTATVRIPARMNLCAATGLAAASNLLVGDRVEVRGARGDDGTVTPCEGADHHLVRRSASGQAVYRGLFESGFETSSFSPCDQPEVRWWVGGTDDTFRERYDAIRAAHVPAEGRGTRLYVEATVVGELTDEGEYGHLGMYSRRITITETRDMVFLAADPDSTVTCR